MKPWILCLIVAGLTMAQTNEAAATAHGRLAHARELRRAQNQNQSIMFRMRSPRAATPRVSFDNSGNSMLKGAYFVRQVLLVADSNSSAITQAVSLTGTMTFDGNGNYSFSGQQLNSANQAAASNYTVSGVYAVSSSGQVQIQTPVGIDSQDTEFGGVGAAGEVIASATENGYQDIFVAIPEGPASGVTGAYQVGFIDFLQANASNVRNGYFTMTASGGNSFGNVTVNGEMLNQGSQATTQSLSGVSYSFSGNIGTITFPTASNPLTALVSGAKTFAVSPDGNILVGGNPNGFDLFVAVKSASSVSNATYTRTYFQGGLENATNTCGQQNCIDAFYGSVLPNGQGVGTQHQREAGYNFSSFDYTADIVYNFPAGGSFADPNFEWLMGANGEAVLQVGLNGYYTLIPQFQAALLSGKNPFLNPDGILNAASFAPITNSVAPGEYVAMFGTGLASTQSAGSLPLPTTLGGAMIPVNSVPSPLYAASANLITAIVPNETQVYNVASFQVSAGGSTSNSVTLYTASTAPGVFTSTQNGVGPADVFHSNYTYVTQNSPAAAGETVFFYATGLGSTSPAVADGAAAPGSPLAAVNDPNFAVDIYDSQGGDTQIQNFTAVLAPTLAGVYQVNITIPSGIASGEGYLDVSTTDGYTSEAKIYIK
jgi:uncharacterized protein (TIGR03437 family)